MWKNYGTHLMILLKFQGIKQGRNSLSFMVISNFEIRHFLTMKTPWYLKISLSKFHEAKKQRSSVDLEEVRQPS